MGETSRRAPVFPCAAVPAEAGAARLLGLYPQRQDGLWMQRVKAPGGRLSGAQWRALAEAARAHAAGTPLHLTTRQDVELHDLDAADVPGVQRRLADVELTGLGACGDTLRNVTVCPCSGARDGSVDLLPLARLLQRRLEGLACIRSLPRKFKINLSCGSGDCGQAWINDLGLVAEKGRGQWGFRAIAAGSLGSRPGTGMPLLDRVEPGDVPALAVAAVEFFNDHGDRDHRGRARLRHVRQRLGGEAFAAKLAERFEAAKARRGVTDVRLPEAVGGLDGRVVLTFPDGDVGPDAAEALAGLSDRDDLAVRMAIEHRVIVFGRGAGAKEAVAGFGALRAPAERQPAVVACPGTRWCSRGLTDTNGLARWLRRGPGEILPASTVVCISGCPNGCGQSAVAEVGLIGRVTNAGGGDRREVYDVLIGGGRGRDARLAAPAARKVPAEDVPAVVAELIGRQRAGP